MSVLTILRDSFVNLVSGLGTYKDPTKNTSYDFEFLPKDALDKAYRGDWIAARIVDAPAEDATREWRSWQADKEQIELLEEIEKNHAIQGKLKATLIRARLYGGAAMVLGVGDTQPEEPLDLEKVKKDDLKFVAVMSCHELTPGQRIDNLLSPWYGRPEFYRINTPVYGVDNPSEAAKKFAPLISYGSSSVMVHPSRVIEFIGNELPDFRLAPLGGSWGDSVLQRVDDIIKKFGLTIGGIAAMINDAKIDVIKIPEFTSMIKQKEYADNLYARFLYANMSKSSINALLIDAAEEWQRTQTNFGGLPNLLNEIMTVVAGAAEIPISRLIGQSPGQGLAAAGAAGGDTDLRNYYDKISSRQRNDNTPRMRPLDEIIQRSALGKYDPKIFYEWRPLWQMSEKEKAEISFVKAQATNLDVQMGLINEDALRKGRVNQMIEDGTYAGFEDAIDEFGDEPEDPPPGIDPLTGKPLPMALPGAPAKPGLPPAKPLLQLAKPKPKTPVKDEFDDMLERVHAFDAQPRTLYVRRDLINVDDLRTWAKAQGFFSFVEDPHVTIAYSRAMIDWMKVTQTDWGEDENGHLRVKPGGVRLIEQLGNEGAVVLLFGSSALCYRHEEIVNAGASFDYQDYQPHVTISYNGSFALEEVEPYRGELIFGPEVWEEVGENDQIEEISL